MLTLVVVHAAVAMALPFLARPLGRLVWVPAAMVPAAALAWGLAQLSSVIGGTPVRDGFAWAPSLGLRVEMLLDPLSLLMVCVVSGVGAAVFAYSAFYTERRDAGRQAGLLVAFAGAMFGLVVADNLFVLYVFWELTSVASFLLIAGRGRGEEQRRAAEQALLVTVGGGLAMLLGFVMLGQAAGTYQVSELVADPPRGGLVPVALALVLLGAFAKSAQMPLHGWLPAAMVAPTPVSAYLHAAAMVKAGVYLVARLAPGFADVGLWRPTVLTVGLLTMVLGAWRALRETDLKLLLAYGTISELGMLTALLGAGSRTAALAGGVMLLAHASFKATLFLVVGVLDHRAGTRDLRELSGVGRRMPGLFTVALLAAASMAGLPPLVGFLGKEAAYEAFLHGTGDLFVEAGLFAGSVLTVGYAARFLWGAFARKPGPAASALARPSPGLVAPAAVLSSAGLVLGLWYAGTGALASAYADSYPSGGSPYQLALWHGLTSPLALSAATLALGAAVHLGRNRWVAPLQAAARLPDAQRGYREALGALDRLATGLTRRTQVGSLPVYQTVLVLAVLLAPGTALVVGGVPVEGHALWTSPVELPLAVVVLAAAAGVCAARHRLTAMLLVGAAGYGVAGFFLVHGAPDLALTQVLVESLTLVIVVLVLRQLPKRFTSPRPAPWTRWLRLVVAVGVGVFVALFALATSAARHPPPVSVEHLRRAAETGADNVVNAIIVDFRALDTLGEISVLLVTAIGVASLVRLPREDGGTLRQDRRRPSPQAYWDEPREHWLPGAGERPGTERSVLLEVVTRLLFPAVLMLSLYLLFSGHYRPGGGFAGGLVAGQAFVLRYLVGGHADLGFAAPVAPGIVAGGGVVLAAASGAVPMAFGAAPLSSTIAEFSVPLLGHVEFATSVFFDIGVYLLVVGVVLKLLSAVGTSLTPGAEEEDSLP